MNLDELTIADLKEGRSDLVKKLNEEFYGEVQGEIDEMKGKLAEAQTPEVTLEWLKKSHADVLAEHAETLQKTDPQDDDKVGKLQADVETLKADNRRLVARDILRSKLAESKISEWGKALVSQRLSDTAPEDGQAYAAEVDAELEGIAKYETALAESKRAPGVPVLSEAGEDFDPRKGIRKAAGIKEEEVK